jgi:HpcH/HpaI aldolase/citrate lyase family
MATGSLTGAEFKKQLRAGTPKLGIFLNAHSPTVAEQLSHSGYDWLLVDSQHGPMGYEKLSAMLSGISNGGAKSLVRVGSYSDRPGIQQSLDLGADGILVPYINSADEARAAVTCARYPTVGTRSVYFPQRSMNREGLLDYAGGANNNVIVALQVETADCTKNIDEIAAVPAWTSSSSAKTISACPWGCMKSTSSRTCTLRPSSAPPRRSSLPRRARTMSYLASSFSEPPASANFSTRVSPSSASATIFTTSSPRLRPT